jgi:hypothetical protein
MRELFQQLGSTPALQPDATIATLTPASHIEPQVFNQPVPRPVNTQPRTIPRSQAQKGEIQRLPSNFECYELYQPSQGGPQRGLIARPRSYEVLGTQAPIQDFVPSVEGGAAGPSLLDQTDDLPTIEQIFKSQLNPHTNRGLDQQGQHQRHTLDCIIVDLEDEGLCASP